MANFKFYFNDGRTIQLELAFFRIEEQKLVLYNTSRVLVENSFISLKDVDAIIPDEFEKSDTSENYFVYLKSQTEPFKITVFDFEVDEDSNIHFTKTDFHENKSTMRYIFVRYSEVIAILPAEYVDIENISAG